MICCIVLYAFGKMLNHITMEVPLYDYQVYTFYSVGPPLRELGTGVSTERIERGAYRAFREDSALGRKVRLYLYHMHTAQNLKEIGNRFGIRESGFRRRAAG